MLCDARRAIVRADKGKTVRRLNLLVGNLLPCAIVFALCVSLGCKQAEPDVTKGVTMKLEITSTAFANGAAIPKQYTGDGQDASPPLRWSDPPESTKSFALICDDPDAPRGMWVHWVLFNLPASARDLPEGVRAVEALDNKANQGKNDFGTIGYGGPAPPKGKPHRYFFKVYALDTILNLPAGATKNELLASMKDHVLAVGEIMGRYGR
jgi:Raf kinase inhibitor-like YbhB/YbcL family protein